MRTGREVGRVPAVGIAIDLDDVAAEVARHVVDVHGLLLGEVVAGQPSELIDGRRAHAASQFAAGTPSAAAGIPPDPPQRAVAAYALSEAPKEDIPGPDSGVTGRHAECQDHFGFEEEIGRFPAHGRASCSASVTKSTVNH